MAPRCYGTQCALCDSHYQPPHGRHQVPQQRFVLGMLPTPIHRWHVPGLPADVEMWIKRDDLSGMQMSGNKARALA